MRQLTAVVTVQREESKYGTYSFLWFAGCISLQILDECEIRHFLKRPVPLSCSLRSNTKIVRFFSAKQHGKNTSRKGTAKFIEMLVITYYIRFIAKYAGNTFHVLSRTRIRQTQGLSIGCVIELHQSTSVPLKISWECFRRNRT